MTTLWQRSRSPVAQEGSALVRVSPPPSGDIPMIVQPAIPGVDAAAWAQANGGYLAELLLKHRALMFRGFGIATPEAFEAFCRACSTGTPMSYRDRSSPRHSVGPTGIYTSTDYPADREIFLHHEGTYWNRWPRMIAFCCCRAAETGGATQIADGRRVLIRLPATVCAQFEAHGISYVRNFNEGFGLTWQESFQTEDAAEVEAYCRTHAIDWDWKPDGRLRTRQTRPAFAVHPVTGETLWFNHATFFHATTSLPEVREMLLKEVGEENLPYDATYGDGAAIEPKVLDLLRDAYRAEERELPWQVGDILLLDNMTIAHGRRPFQGKRLVLSAMLDPTGHAKAADAAE